MWRVCHGNLHSTRSRQIDSPRSAPIKVALNLRDSTANQTTENQRRELERVATLRGWSIVETYTDHGVSDAKSRSDRFALDRMLKDAVRGRFNLKAVWSIDRLGRSLQHLVETVNELQAVGCDLYPHQNAIDTTTPARKLAFNIFGAFAEFERSLIRERVMAGLSRARLAGVRLGRPTNLTDAVGGEMHALKARNVPIRQIASQLRVGTGTVYAVLGSAT